MSYERYHNQGSGPKEESRIRRLSHGLLTTLALIALYLTLTARLPDAASRIGEGLKELLERSRDLSVPFHHLGWQLERGADPMRCVEDWCVTVFLPAEIPADSQDGN